MVHCIVRLSFTLLQAQLAAEEEKFWQEQLATLLQVRACTEQTNRPLQREPTTPVPYTNLTHPTHFRL